MGLNRSQGRMFMMERSSRSSLRVNAVEWHDVADLVKRLT